MFVIAWCQHFVAFWEWSPTVAKMCEFGKEEERFLSVQRDLHGTSGLNIYVNP